MKTLIYVGPHEAVEVPLPDGRSPVVENGGTLETSDEHAASLLEQPSNWQPAGKAGRKDDAADAAKGGDS